MQMKDVSILNSISPHPFRLSVTERKGLPAKAVSMPIGILPSSHSSIYCPPLRENTATQHGNRHEPAITAADYPAHHVRDDQTDPTDHSVHRNRASGHKSRRYYDSYANPSGVYAHGFASSSPMVMTFSAPTQKQQGSDRQAWEIRQTDVTPLSPARDPMSQ